VHFAIAASEEQASFVQDADMAVEAIHAVAIVHEVPRAGSQQPWMAKLVLVAQTSVGFGHVTALTVEE
jgi:hypothetical protein